jgi:hypothetical protein
MAAKVGLRVEVQGDDIVVILAGTSYGRRLVHRLTAQGMAVRIAVRHPDHARIELLNRSAVGLGASLVPPSGTGMSVLRQENDLCSMTALLPSARAITVGFALALSGSACHRRTVSSMCSRFIWSPTFFIGAHRSCLI